MHVKNTSIILDANTIVCLVRSIRLVLNCAFYVKSCEIMRINCYYYSHDNFLNCFVFIRRVQQLLFCLRLIDIHISLYLQVVPSRCHCAETDQISFRKMVLNFINFHIATSFFQKTKQIDSMPCC